jgi:hypothetical protein
VTAEEYMFSGAFDCPHCGAPPVRIEARLRAATEVTCERSHRWRPEDRLEILSRRDIQIRVAGRLYACDCGCNVFHLNPNGRYQCNGCAAEHEGRRA